MRSSSRTWASCSSTIRTLAFRISAGLTMTGVSPGKFQCHGQRAHELVDPDGLGEIPEESRLQAVLDVPGDRVRAEGEDWDVLSRRVVAQNLHGFDAADAGQADVHQDDVRPGC